MYVVYLCPSVRGTSLGAAEQDLVAGINILRGSPALTVFWLSLDLMSGVIFDHQKNEILPSSKLTLSNLLTYAKYKLLAFDNASRKPFRLMNFHNLQTYLTLNKIDVIVTSTNSVVVYGVASRKNHIFRSHNYEPLHAFGEVKNRMSAVIHYLLKYLTVSLELRADVVWAISPRDLRLYKTHRGAKGKTIFLVPNMQFAESKIFKQKNLEERRKKILSVGFLGSTYSVLHNQRALGEVLKIFSHINYQDNKSSFLLNVYGKKIELVNQKPSSNVRFKGWVGDINQIFNDNDIFIVPYVGGAGMQSKVFEPLFMGKLLLCDPRALAEFQFFDNQHFLSAVDSSQFIEQLNWIYEHQDKCRKIAVEAKKKALLLFSRENFEVAIAKSFGFISHLPKTRSKS